MDAFVVMDTCKLHCQCLVIISCVRIAVLCTTYVILSSEYNTLHCMQSTYETSIDVLPSKNQVLCEYCTHVNQLKHC